MKFTIRRSRRTGVGSRSACPRWVADAISSYTNWPRDKLTRLGDGERD